MGLNLRAWLIAAVIFLAVSIVVGAMLGDEVIPDWQSSAINLLAHALMVAAAALVYRRGAQEFSAVRYVVAVAPARCSSTFSRCASGPRQRSAPARSPGAR